jgi:hypothetical protein
MKQKIKQILNTITPQDLEEGCSRQVEEIGELVNLELKKYTEFLYKNGYTDDDVFNEEPSAVRRYITSNNKTKL